MDKVMMISGGQYYYWKPVIIAIAALAAAILAVALCIWRRESLPALFAALPVGAFLSIYAARLIHWYCRFESYEGLSAALTNLRSGGFSLIGVFAGMLLAFLLVRLLRLTDRLPALLDCAAPAAALGIALGRLGDLFTAADRGKMILESEALHRLPYSYAVVNATSGATEWRFATFFAQSLWAALLFVILLVLALAGARRRSDGGVRRGSGNLFLMFMALYSYGQIVTDSTRYDALFLRSNGFVSLEQILCAVVVAAVLVYYSVRSVRRHGLRVWHIALWLAALAGLGWAGYMEYYVQRHGNLYPYAYSMMCLGLLVSFAVVLLLFFSCASAPSRRKRSKARRGRHEAAPKKAPPAEDADRPEAEPETLTAEMILMEHRSGNER